MSTSLKKIKDILELLNEYANNSSEDNIRKRLDKCLQLYLSDLDTSYYYLVDNINKKSVIRNINKCE